LDRRRSAAPYTCVSSPGPPRNSNSNNNNNNKANVQPRSTPAAQLFLFLSRYCQRCAAV
jgi:hypothetical protein